MNVTTAHQAEEEVLHARASMLHSIACRFTQHPESYHHNVKEKASAIEIAETAISCSAANNTTAKA
jgi:hypothetical protein